MRMFWVGGWTITALRMLGTRADAARHCDVFAERKMVSDVA